jgi:hypothetical protein
LYVGTRTESKFEEYTGQYQGNELFPSSCMEGIRSRTHPTAVWDENKTRINHTSSET